MFESLIQDAHAASDSSGEGELLIGKANPLRTQGGGALRALEWNDVTARLTLQSVVTDRARRTQRLFDVAALEDLA